MYLEPLVERARQHGGRIYAGHHQPLTLLVDIKADGEAAYAALDALLREAPDVFTEFDRGVVYPRAVTVIISGAMPRQTMAQQAHRFAFVDGRITDLSRDTNDEDAATGLVPLVSMRWGQEFKWHGLGEMPAAEREKLAELVRKAHARGYRIRFWAVPNLDFVWTLLYDAGVDLINVDDLPRAAEVLGARE